MALRILTPTYYETEIFKKLSQRFQTANTIFTYNDDNLNGGSIPRGGIMTAKEELMNLIMSLSEEELQKALIVFQEHSSAKRA